MSTNNNRYPHQHMLPGLSPLDSATPSALDAAKLAYEQERLATELERQRLLRDQQQHATNRDQREAANFAARQGRDQDAHNARQHYDALRAQAQARKDQLDEEYKQEQLNFMRQREHMRSQQDFANLLGSLMQTYGKLWYWEEQIRIQQIDVAMRHWENWAKIRLQALNDYVLRQIAFLKFQEMNRHNLEMEGETNRHNQQMEVQSWWIAIWRFQEECRNNHTREFVEAWKGYYQLLETQRANNMRGQNDANRNAEQVRHNVRMEDQQAEFNAARLSQSRGGFKSIVATVGKTLVALFILFCMFCVFVFTHWTGQAQPYDNTCMTGFVVVFLVIVLIAVLKIRNAIVRANQEKAYRKQLAQWQQNMASVPPALQVQQGQVPPWMYPQYQQQNHAYMPPSGMWNGGQPPFPPTF